ncbi:MAG TPA: 7TM diverse intracellular signaling domain-containing protein, partial [Cryomorphaceae bacterium]|nr:7TM diverse intracellular signaling domain-containing protein [Cryomorphaceae bacterium]
FASENAKAGDTLRITSDFGKSILGSELSVHREANFSSDVSDVLNQEFEQVDSPRPNLGFNKGALWVKTSIQNLTENEDYRIQIHQPLLDTIKVYILDEGGRVVKEKFFGESLNFSHREYSAPPFILDLTIPQGEFRTVLLRITTAEQIVLPIYVTTIRSSEKLLLVSNLLFGAYFGLILVMAFYNFFIYLTVRDRSYLIYVLYIIAVGSTQAVLEGYMQQFFWPDNTWLASRSPYLFTAVLSITSIIFLQDFLKTKIYAPRVNKFSWYIYGYFLLIFVVALFGASPIVHMATQVGITALSFYILTAGIIVYKSGYSPAKFFILAWGVLVAGIIVYALQDSGLIPSTPLTNYMMLIGSALEAILLSIALADRINILKREKSQSQEQALRVSLENEKIVKEQNIVLEERVTERTADLENTNSKLNSAISELKETQSQLVQAEKMASLGQLTAGVAHEINNPINFVSANIAPLRFDVKDILDVLDMYDSIPDAETFEAKKKSIEKFKEEIDLNYSKQEVNQLLEGIEEGAKRTAEIVKGLKNFSRIDESSVKESDLNEGIRSTLNILRNSISPVTKVNMDLAENLPLVECMPGKINQVFMNIMNNGIQAMHDNTCEKASVLTIKTSYDDKYVQIEIGDTGAGMDERTKSRIFEPFFTTKDVGQGTGLGLSIVFKIIETHDGKIYVESEEGKGTIFVLKLPINARIKSELEL